MSRDETDEVLGSVLKRALLQVMGIGQVVTVDMSDRHPIVGKVSIVKKFDDECGPYLDLEDANGG